MPIPKTARAPARQRGRGALIHGGRGLAVTFSRARLWPSLGLGAALTVLLAVLVAAQPARAADLRALVDQAAVAAGIPAAIAHAVIAQESGYRPALRGAAGEWGLGQIKCRTAHGVGFRGACGQLADPATNLRFSFAYLRQALALGGAGCVGVSLYQSGLGGRRGCSSYGRRVMARAGR